jgi:hypothetical protein
MKSPSSVGSTETNPTSNGAEPLPRVYLPATLAGSKRTVYLTWSTGTIGIPVFTATYENGVDIYAVRDNLAPSDLVKFRRTIDDMSDQKIGVHSRVEIVAHGLDYMLFSADATTAQSAAVALEKS